MGWFDSLFPSSTRIDVNTYVSRMVSDEDLPDSIKSGTIKALFEDGNLSDYLMEETVASVAVRAERMYSYAERKYAYGMPSGEIYVSLQERSAVEDVLKRLHDYTVAIEYSKFGAPNILHCGWVQLDKLYGYNAATNQITSLTNSMKTPVYLQDMVVVIPTDQLINYSAAALTQYGVAPRAGYTPNKLAQSGAAGSLVIHSPIETSDTATEAHVLMTYCWEEIGTYIPTGYTYPIVGKILKTASVVISIAEFKPAADYYQVRYKHAGKTYFFMYESGTGLYPTLDSAFDTPTQVMGEFFPFAYFRYGKAPMNVNKGGAGYKTSKKMLSYLNIDYDTLIEGVHENPGIGDVEQAMLTMAIPANATDKLGARYLFDFFNKMYYFLPAQFTSVNEMGLATPLASPPVGGTAIVIKDSLFTMTLSNDGIVKKRKTGQIGPKGTYNTAVESSPYEVKVRKQERENEYEYIETHYIYTHVYRFQVSDATYDEIRVTNLTMKYFIWGGHTTIGDENDPILLVPLDRSIAKNYTLQDREDLYTRSLYFVFNSLVRTEIKWYQSSFFQFILIAAAIVVTVVTYGAAWQASAAAIAAGTMTVQALVIAIAIGVLKFLVVSAIIKMFVKEVGAEAALVIAIIAAAVAGYQYFSTEGVAGAPWANDLLALSSNLSQGVQDNLKELMTDLNLEAENYGLFVDQQEAKLKEANDLLKQDNLLSPFVIFGESPNDFYNRTVHSGNIGVVGIEAISSYVDSALMLPKLSETVGGELYG